jgi:hypothetical protein
MIKHDPPAAKNLYQVEVAREEVVNALCIT